VKEDEYKESEDDEVDDDMNEPRACWGRDDMMRNSTSTTVIEGGMCIY